jgi:hypothetical protein
MDLASGPLQESIDGRIALGKFYAYDSLKGSPPRWFSRQRHYLYGST